MKNDTQTPVSDPQSDAPKPNRAAWFLPLLLFCLLIMPGGGYLVWTGTRAVLPKTDAASNAPAALAGVAVEEAYPAFRLRGWLSGDFQTRFGRWFGQHFALRSEMVKTNNQIGYTVFRKSNTGSAGLVVGRGKTLYEEGYVREYCGLYPPTPPAIIERLVADMEDIGARLQARGIGFVVCITPSKAAIYPENIPPAYLARKSSAPRSYDVAVAALKRRNVLTVDGHTALMEGKTARPDDLFFCQGGTHYNDLGMLTVLRPLLRAIETAGQKTVPTVRWNTPVPVDTTPTLWDTDLTRMLNVWNPPSHFLSPHPVAVFDTSRTQTERVRRVVVVGDSFCWQPVFLLSEKRVFDRLDFYYYYHTEHHRYPDNQVVPLGPMQNEWKNTLLKSDVIVLEMCESQLRNGGQTHFAAFLQDAKKYLPKSASPAASDLDTAKR